MANSFKDEILTPSFRLEGPHLVAASAGTGKTYNIQNICARLVMENGLRIAQIQVMTFTEAATRELRGRIRKVLSDLSRFFAGDVAGFRPNEIERLEKLRGCARAKIPGGEAAADRVARGRVELALMEFDQAAISTIHGFCRRALVRFAFETGGAFQSEFADDKGEDLDRRARDWWRTRRGGQADDFALADLRKAVLMLGGKADWTVEGDGSGNGERLLRAAEAIVASYEEDRPLRETQTFDDLLRGLREALRDSARGPLLAARLREEFRAVLVDEFQDTDPVQYEIFRRVFLDPAADPQPALFFVGDPKQAIYSFRGGDIYTYRAAVTSPAIADHTSRLDRNFRSTPRLIDAVNRLFGDRREPDGTVTWTFGDKTIDYPGDLQSSDVDALKLSDGTDDPKPFRIVLADKAAQREKAVIEAVLGTLAEQRGRLTPRDIAILVPSHEAGRGYCDALRARGVPVVLQKAGNVFAGETAAEFRQVALAMARMGGRGQVRAALATPFFDFSAAELARDDGEALAEMIGWFGDVNALWLRRGFNAAFAAVEAHPRCDLRRRFARMKGGERMLADIFQVVDLVGGAIAERGPAPEVVVDWLTERINLAGTDAAEADTEEYARQLESENDAVRIMTCHVSKGLEFPVAIVPVTSGMAVSPPYFHHDGDGALLVGLDATLVPAAQAEAEAERMRLLYVAFTRASGRTIVVATPPKSGSPLARLFDNARSRNAGEDNPPDSPILWTKAEGDAKGEDGGGAAERADVAPPGNPPQLQPAAIPRVYSHVPTMGSYTSLSPADHGGAADGHDVDSAPATPRGVAGADGAHADFKLGGGARTGTCWHEILEKLPFDASSDAIADVTRRALRLHGLASPDEETFASDAAIVADMVGKTLDWRLDAPDGATFSLRDVAWADRFSEWEFDFPSADAVATTEAVAGILRDEWGDDPAKAPFLKATKSWKRPIPKGFLKGFIDLLFRHGGYYYVVDWKSNGLDGRLANFDHAGVTAEMAKAGYFFQYLLYAVVLHRFLRETLGASYAWERNFGGIRYYFLRGIAAGGAAPVFADRPTERLLDRLADALGLGGR